MQPPQGFEAQNGYGGQEDSGVPAWNQLPTGTQWVQRPVPGQMPGGQPMQPGQAPGQVPPPAQIAPEPVQTPYYGTPQPGGYQSAPQGGQVPPAAQAPVQPGAQPSGYQIPKTGMPRGTRKKGKGGYIFLALVVIAFAAFAVIRMLSPASVRYGYVRYGSMSSLYSGDAVLVRNETVDTQESVSQIDFAVEEGAQVTRGTVVATIYTSGFNAKEWVTLQNYRNQIKDYHKVLIAGATTDTSLLSRMSQVQARAMEVQRLVHGAQGSISFQETLLKEAMLAQQIYIKQKYPDDQKLGRLYDDENTQQQRISTWTKQFAASADGLVSFYTDGYEKGLNMNTYGDFTPAQVRSMYNGTPPAVVSTVNTRNSTDIYRMVRKDRWAVLMLCNEKDWTPVSGRTYNLVIESFDNYVLSATVDTFTRSGGELLVRLLVDNTDFLPSALYLRSCQVRLGENVNSLMVPSRAIYVQNGRKGVVMATEGGEYWTGVEVISDDGNTAYVVPDNAGVLYDGVPVRLF
ncbi:MAG: HlyD family efflux transporter periplasmic adaptor subunit [Clostridia bacterium]|nr:HlyD family efflux transporter periplasmic adaptor subunit [Clostridia bacterium]